MDRCVVLTNILQEGGVRLERVQERMRLLKVPADLSYMRRLSRLGHNSVERRKMTSEHRGVQYKFEIRNR